MFVMEERGKYHHGGILSVIREETVFVSAGADVALIGVDTLVEACLCLPEHGLKRENSIGILNEGLKRGWFLKLRTDIML